ncbi:putative PIN domain-like protein [Lyophyllum shimeji]|uniref:PIN domain-like protein n=1 Tax=Lyophyllum shimeji TaxID=47721 RepID=A0A9P3PK88_LYOSH|nr:putative PIN domain-like protein [Lyophyllum shimeji]
MGVHGLTTYLRENYRAISTTLTLPAKSQDPIPIVVDGWSFIYDLHRNSNLPWVYGGEYDQYSQLAAAVVRAWLNVGLKIYFVFDGALPELKFSTQVYRLGQSFVQPSLLFFRTSPTSRGTARFLNETRIIPPLVYTACIHALKTVKKTTDALEIHFADEEGDPYAVELAGRVGGYVAGNDSDFVVLNTEGYLGYIPLEEMVCEFQEVRRPKAKKKPVHDPSVGRGIIPPDATEQVTLSLTAYKPDALAAHLKIPVTLLPLLGALVGNDFSFQSESNRRYPQSLFFDRKLTLSQRIDRVASTMQTILSPVAPKRKQQKHAVGSVMDLIDRAVNALLLRMPATLGSGEVDAIVDRIVEATLQYAIPRREHDTLELGGLWPTTVCALHEPDACSFLPLISRRVLAEEEAADENHDIQNASVRLRSQYLDAYRHGHLAPKIMDILSSATFWPRLFLENPDFETVGRSIGRPIREWIYSILHDAVGLSEPPEEESEVESAAAEPQQEEEHEDEDELIDVVESDSEDGDDPLAPLKGELHRLHITDEERASTSAASSSSRPSRPSRPPVVTEYLRRGTRVAEEAVTVRPLTELLAAISLPDPDTPSPIPLPLRHTEERLTVLLRALESDVPPVRALPPEQMLPVLAIRWVLRTLDRRAEETQSKAREKERWTKREVTAFLASFDWTASRVSEAPDAVSETEVPTPILDRNVQLMAQALQALESVEHLSQALLLTDALLPSVHLLSSRAFHRYMAESGAFDEAVVPPLMIEAASYGLESTFGEDRLVKPKKVKQGTGIAVPSKNAKVLPGGSGLYHLLADIDVM